MCKRWKLETGHFQWLGSAEQVEHRLHAKERGRQGWCDSWASDTEGPWWCHAKAFRIHPVGNREPLKIFKGDMIQNVWEIPWPQKEVGKDIWQRTSFQRHLTEDLFPKVLTINASSDGCLLFPAHPHRKDAEKQFLRTSWVRLGLCFHWRGSGFTPW